MDLAQVLKIAIRYSWVIVLFGVVAGAAAFVASSTLPKQYESEARVLVGSLTEADLQQQLGYRELAGMYASIANAPIVLADVAAELEIDDPLDEIADRIDASTLVGESIVRIRATADSPSEAAELAGAVAIGIVDLASAPPVGPDAPPVGPDAATVGLILARVVQPPVEDETASYPNVLVNTAVGAFAGMALGLLAVLLSDGRLAARSKQPLAAPQPGVPQYPPGPYSR